jgi:ribosome-binding protein aMBF1 (putative translation factor)
VPGIFIIPADLDDVSLRFAAFARTGCERAKQRSAVKNPRVVRGLRVARGFSLRRLAARADLDHTTIHRIEGGLPPTQTQVAKLAKGLGVRAKNLEQALALSSEP